VFEIKVFAPTRIRPGLVHFSLAVGGFAIGTTEFATMSLLRYFARDLHIDEPTAGHVISSYALGVVVGAPIIAVLSARVARRTLLMGLMGVFALGNLLSAWSPTYAWMLLFRFLSGLPHGAYFGIATLVAASLVPTEKRTQAVGRVLLGLTVATIVGVPLANWMGRTYGWRWAFVVVAGLALLCAVLIALYAPRDRILAGFGGEEHAERLVRRVRQLLDPVPVQRVALEGGEPEEQRNGRLDPDAAAAVAESGVIPPGEKESLVAPKLRADDHLKVREHPIFEIDFDPGISVEQLSQRTCPSVRWRAVGRSSPVSFLLLQPSPNE